MSRPAVQVRLLARLKEAALARTDAAFLMVVFYFYLFL
jgi:hypothetical protein